MNEDTDKPDTPEKVLADMRALADDIEAGRAIVGQTVWRSFASRFETALKRDRAEIEAAALEAGGVVEAARHKPVGNAAAMREALTKVKEWMEHRIATCGFEFSATIPTMLEDVVLPAFAVPARNCDVFGTKDKSREAFQKLRGHRVLADVSLWDNRDEIEAFLDWVFATKKGEADGK